MHFQQLSRSDALRNRDIVLAGYSLRNMPVIAFRGTILALNWAQARDRVQSPQRPTSLIAISSSRGHGQHGGSFRVPPGIKLIRLKFDDLIEPPGPHTGGRVLFSDNHRTKVLRFINRIDQNCDLLIHCMHGWSRSRGIAAALMRMRGEDDIEHWIQGEPNYYVYRTLLRVERGLQNENPPDGLEKSRVNQTFH